MPDVKEAIANYLGGALRSFAKGAVALAERVMETWGKETLQDPAEDATSSENNSSADHPDFWVQGKDLLFTGDAGVPALDRASTWRKRSVSALQPAVFSRYPTTAADAMSVSTLLDRLVGPQTARPERHYQDRLCFRCTRGTETSGTRSRECLYPAWCKGDCN